MYVTCEDILDRLSITMFFPIFTALLASFEHPADSRTGTPALMPDMPDMQTVVHVEGSCQAAAHPHWADAGTYRAVPVLHHAYALTST